MQGFHSARISKPRLRLVFKNGAVSFGLSAGATLADVAELVEQIARRKHSVPLAVAVKMAVAPSMFPASKGASHAAH
jgi:hypothetical protein